MVDPTPFWVTCSAAAIRRMPFGRYFASHALGRVNVPPFLMRLPADAGSQVFICDLRDSISREVCFTGRYEPQETQLLARLLAPGMTAIDAGAHWGYFTLMCAHLVGPRGHVVAFEPDARLMALLSANVLANRLTHVECVAAAAAATNGTAQLAGFRESDGNWGTSRIVETASAGVCEVPTVAIDDVVAQRGNVVVDLVKIDVEGSECEVLRGMAHGLHAGRYRHVILECHPTQLAERGVSLEACLEPLHAAGYRGWLIDHSPEMHRRAAAGPLAPSEFLRPLRTADLPSLPWPHVLFSAPGARPLVECT